MIEQHTFGRTGHPSTRTLFGGAAFWTCGQKEADQVLDLLLEHGVNHIDTAPSYGDSELRIGPWMKTHRDTFFLATKTGKRTYAEAKDEIRQSLERLQVEQVDLLQLHNLVEADEWEAAMGPGGAMEAVVEAREQGLARFIGVTGHGIQAPAMHLRSLERYDFDSVLVPWNWAMWQNADYRAGFEALRAECEKRNVAIQTIKSIARGGWGDKPQNRETWYEPLEDQPAIDRAIHWVLGHPGLFINTVGDIHILPKVLDAAARFSTQPTEEEMEANHQAHGITPLFPGNAP